MLYISSLKETQVVNQITNFYYNNLFLLIYLFNYYLQLQYGYIYIWLYIMVIYIYIYIYILCSDVTFLAFTRVWNLEYPFHNILYSPSVCESHFQKKFLKVNFALIFPDNNRLCCIALLSPYWLSFPRISQHGFRSMWVVFSN